MEVEPETLWVRECLDSAWMFGSLCKELRGSKPSSSEPTLNVVISALATELWDNGFSETEIRQALSLALKGLPTYTAGEERRGDPRRVAKTRVLQRFGRWLAGWNRGRLGL